MFQVTYGAATHFEIRFCISWLLGKEKRQALTRSPSQSFMYMPVRACVCPRESKLVSVKKNSEEYDKSGLVFSERRQRAATFRSNYLDEIAASCCPGDEVIIPKIPARFPHHSTLCLIP